MAYRLPGKRVALDLDGPSVEVEPIHAWAIQLVGTNLWQAFEDAATPQAELNALGAIGRFLVAEAQPVWDIVDHRGPIPVSETGMLRLPHTLLLEIHAAWLATFSAEQPASAVDALIPPGPARNEVKRRLRAVKAA